VAIGNQQFSILALTDASGTVVERVAYQAYGQPTFTNAAGTTLSGSSKATRYSYTGREWDASLEFHHFRARWVSGVSGRFLGRDPIGYYSGLDVYAIYFSIDGSDPSGLGPDHDVRWDHHWFPQSAYGLKQTSTLCGCIFGKGVDSQGFVNQWTTPMEPGGTRSGLLHGYLEHTFRYREQWNTLASSANNCCELMLGTVTLMISSLLSAEIYHNGPDGPLSPDPANFLPWPTLVPYHSSLDAMDTTPTLLMAITKACGPGQTIPSTRPRSPIPRNNRQPVPTIGIPISGGRIIDVPSETLPKSLGPVLRAPLPGDTEPVEIWRGPYPDGEFYPEIINVPVLPRSGNRSPVGGPLNPGINGGRSPVRPNNGRPLRVPNPNPVPRIAA